MIPSEASIAKGSSVGGKPVNEASQVGDIASTTTLSYQILVAPKESVQVNLTLTTSPWLKLKSAGVTLIQGSVLVQMIVPLLLTSHFSSGVSIPLSRH